MLRKFFPISGVGTGGVNFYVITHPPIVFKYAPNPAASPTIPITASASGGSGSYTYAWTIDGDAEVTLSGPTDEASTTIAVAGSGVPRTFHAIATVTATDTATSETCAYDVTVEVQIGGAIE